MMNYERFQQYVLENIREYLPSQYRDIQLEVQMIGKKNGQDQVGLVIKSPEMSFATRISLSPAYHAYNYFQKADPIVQDLAETVGKLCSDMEHIEDLDINQFENIKDRIVIRLLNREWNQEELKHQIYRTIADTDLAVSYQVVLSKTGEGRPCAKVTPAILKRWGISEETLYQAALHNMVSNHPFTVTEIAQAARDEKRTANVIPSRMEDHLPYVLSIEDITGGAAAILYPGVLKRISERFHSNFFIIPSSIHDVLLLRDDGLQNIEELKHMVREVNQEIPEEEVLSNRVYYFDREKEQFYDPAYLETTREFSYERGREEPEMSSFDEDLER